MDNRKVKEKRDKSETELRMSTFLPIRSLRTWRIIQIPAQKVATGHATQMRRISHRIGNKGFLLDMVSVVCRELNLWCCAKDFRLYCEVE